MGDWKPLVLVIEDDKDMAFFNARLLRRHGCETVVANTAAEARRIAFENSPDLFVLDVGLPDGDGISLCKELQQTIDSPTLFLTGKKETNDRIAGLQAGGDYYLTKPYDKDEFVAVVHSLLRRARRMNDLIIETSTISKGSLIIKLDERRAYINGRDAGLSPKEFALLLLLVQNEDKEMPGEKLYESIWNAPMFNNSGAIRVHISNLKKKLGEGSSSDFSIFSGHGKGYMFTTS